MWDQNCLIWVFLGWNSKTLLCCRIFHQHPQFFLNIKLQRKIKILEFGTKKCFIWVLLGCNLLKAIVIFDPPICLITKFGAKNKKPII